MADPQTPPPPAPESSSDSEKALAQEKFNNQMVQSQADRKKRQTEKTNTDDWSVL